MSKFIFKYCIFLFSVASFAQAGHIMQGVGSVNMSMGGAATAQPIDISGALHWNPASLSAFEGRILKFDAGLFFSSPELSSSVTTPTGDVLEGTTKDDRGTSIMPSLAYVCKKEDSKHTFGASVFGISGFGVTFPESTSNPINMPQSMGGFGHIESDYILLQIGLAWAYEITDNFSIGLQPTFDYATLELMPNPTANANNSGYPSTDKASAIGFGGQIGLYYDTGVGFKFGTSYKTPQYFGDFEFKNTHLDNSTAKNKFRMDYPGIWSLGAGYSEGDFDVAVDYRLVDYENTKGFSKTGWIEPVPGSPVAGFGWKNIHIFSAGIQYKGVDKLPLRIGYTYSSNPIDSDVAFFNIPATAIIENAFQFGLSYIVNDKIKLDGLFHYGSSAGDTSGPMLFPGAVSSGNPYGAIDKSNVSYDMTTSMIMVGINYSFGNKTETTE